VKKEKRTNIQLPAEMEMFRGGKYTTALTKKRTGSLSGVRLTSSDNNSI